MTDYLHLQYQHDAADYGYASDGVPILCSPTGSGKTYIAALIAQKALADNRTVGFLTPREEILWQNHTCMGDVNGEHRVAVMKAGEHWDRFKPIQVISWPTLVSRTARSEAWFPHCDLMMIDECHLSTTPKMLERVLPYYLERSQVIGLTATPSRKSGRGLGSTFTEIKHVISVRELIKQQRLCPLEYWAGKYSDVSEVKVTAGDFNAKQLAEKAAPLVGDVIENWCRLASDRHTLVFAVDVAHCEALKERFQMAGIAAGSLHVHMSEEKRQRVVKQFKARQLQVLVNVSIASYGFDAPSVDCIVLARPTKSIVLHLQMLGRGMRVNEGKAHCMVLDHADNVRRLGKADDLYRWRLDKGKQATANWSRDERNPDKEAETPELTECEQCHYLFGRSRWCPKCGWEKPLPKRDIGASEANLVRISTKKSSVVPRGFPDDLTVYRMLNGHVLARGYSSKWAAVNYKKLYGKWPPWDYREYGPLNPSPIVKNWIQKGINDWKRKKRREETRAS